MRISYWSSDVCSSDLAEQRDNITRGDVANSGDAVPTPARRLDADGLMPDKVPYASPAVRLFARELGVDLSRVQGSARGGRITKEDVQQFVKGAMAGGGAVAAGGGGLNLLPWPKVDFSKFGEVRSEEHTSELQSLMRTS